MIDVTVVYLLVAVIGVAVRTDNACPVIRVCLFEDGGDTPQTWQLKASKDTSGVEQVCEIGRAFETFLVGLTTPLRACVVREADDGARGGLTDSRKKRARCEGAVVNAARRSCEFVLIKTGRQTASACGTSLAELDARASQLTTSVFSHAASACLAAQAIAPEVS